ncbi:hypothetical protein KL944_001458 [Ogataea haglerorum]|nr:hypothetical protein KL944_001458 [Ogataea haglerorum]
MSVISPNDENDENDDLRFTFEAHIVLTPMTDNNQNFDSPDTKATSPLKLGRQSTAPPLKSEASETPKDRQDFSYLLEQLSPMPGTWVDEDDKKEPDFNEYVGSAGSSPGSVKDCAVSPFQGELDGQGHLSSPIPHAPESKEGDQLSAFGKVPILGNVLSESLGITHKPGADEQYDQTSNTIQTNEFLNSTMDVSNNSTSTSHSEDDSSVSESNFIDLDKEGYTSPVVDQDKTPVVSSFAFTDGDKTPSSEDAKRFTNPLSSSDVRLSSFRRAGSPLTETPILEEEDEDGETWTSVADQRTERLLQMPLRHAKYSEVPKHQSYSSSIYSEAPESNVGPAAKHLAAIPESSAEPVIPERSSLRATPEPAEPADSAAPVAPFAKKATVPRESTSSSVYEPARAPPATAAEEEPDKMAQMPEFSSTPKKTRVSVRQQSLYQNTYSKKSAVSSNRDLANMESSHQLHELSTDAASVLDDDANEDDASALFVTALHPFDASTLESKNDASICLSFNENDIAFTYSLDDSGWGEVTLLNTLKRGWVPMNYFRATLSEDLEDEPHLSKYARLAASRRPLRKLFRHAGMFLLNPQNKTLYIKNEFKGYTFDIRYINGITQGVRTLLKETDCISRTSDIVQRKPIVRRLRKKLLRDWSDLIYKAEDFLNTMDEKKIEYLQLLAYQVLQKAITFLDVWGLESDDLVNRDKQLISSSHLVPVRYLSAPPHAAPRVNELYNHLMGYFALISGRLDLVEHNAKGGQLLENIVNQINLQVRELQFIGSLIKTIIPPGYRLPAVARSNLSTADQLRLLETNSTELTATLEKFNHNVRALVDVATSGTKNPQMLARSGTATSSSTAPTKDLYFYSKEGGAVINTACQLVYLVSTSFKVLKTFLAATKDFELPNTREYPDFLEMNVSPKSFIKICSAGLVSDKEITRQLKQHKTARGDKRASKRFSMFRAGDAANMELTADGLDFLAEVTPGDGSPFIQNDGTFEQLLDEPAGDVSHEDEVLRGPDNEILGASFRALVCLLTDENNPPEYFFVSTFFLTFRIFSHGSVLLEELVARFDVNNRINENEKKSGAGSLHMHSSLESKMKHRRQLVCKMFMLWLESYWKPRTDYNLLPLLLNFFNEAVKEYLPLEALRLIETASKLIGMPPVETIKDRLNYYNNIDNDSQLVPRKISPKQQHKHISRHISTFSFSDPTGIMNDLDTYNSLLDDLDTYDLEKTATRGSRQSINLGLAIDLKNTDSNVVLLSDKQLESIQKVILSYRNMLREHWQPVNMRLDKFVPLDTQTLLESWWKTAQESWKILNQDLALLNFNGLEIAKQLTLIESKMFCSIKAEELLNQNFTSKKLHLNLSPNIQRSVLFTNLLSDYVIESILQPKLTMKQRVHAVKCWLKIAISCLYLRNFNSLASIMTSLQSFLITRITRIWDNLSDKYKELFQYLASIIHPDKNYNVYRGKIRDFLLSNLEENLDIPSVPYLSLFLQDLTFIVDGNPNYRDNTKSFLNQKLINVDKYTKITKIILDLQTLQIPYRDTGELGKVYNKDQKIDLIRSATIRNLRLQLQDESQSFDDMFDIAGVPCLQELILLEIWKVKQINMKENDRSWKLSCEIQPRDE